MHSPLSSPTTTPPPPPTTTTHHHHQPSPTHPPTPLLFTFPTQVRGIQAPSPDVQLSRGKAPDGAAWPSSTFSTHSPAYAALIYEVLPTLGGMINEYSIFEEGGCDAAMAAKLMQTGCTVSQLCKEIRSVAEQREKASLQRYLAYMHEQKLQVEDQHPQLPSALNLSRPSSSASHQTLSGQALASHASLSTTCLPSSGRGFVWQNSIMERFLVLGPTAVTGADDDSCTVTTAAPQPAPAHTSAASSTAAVTTAVAQPAPAHTSAASSTAAFNDAALPVPSVSPQLEIPEWLFVHGQASAFNVSTDNITTMMRQLHQKLKPFLTADLLGRHPGKPLDSRPSLSDP